MTPDRLKDTLANMEAQAKNPALGKFGCVPGLPSFASKSELLGTYEMVIAMERAWGWLTIEEGEQAVKRLQELQAELQTQL